MQKEERKEKEEGRDARGSSPGSAGADRMLPGREGGQRCRHPAILVPFERSILFTWARWKGIKDRVANNPLFASSLQIEAMEEEAEEEGKKGPSGCFSTLFRRDCSGSQGKNKERVADILLYKFLARGGDKNRPNGFFSRLFEREGFGSPVNREDGRKGLRRRNNVLYSCLEE